ncbi:hypothetical protein AVEN_223447-1 [Araneus ventricosus]|uniref:Uncharacterized protein n=1 Tax=Araneus ventricosus TaxID=182803 RepID=A0A4Y2ESG2_ARAVE|nr:hypothetical protein AVEN_223447-1 [Araneus ventricosus]
MWSQSQRTTVRRVAEAAKLQVVTQDDKVHLEFLHEGNYISMTVYICENLKTHKEQGMQHNIQILRHERIDCNTLWQRPFRLSNIAFATTCSYVKMTLLCMPDLHLKFVKVFLDHPAYRVKYCLVAKHRLCDQRSKLSNRYFIENSHGHSAAHRTEHTLWCRS